MEKETWCFIDFENLPNALEYALKNNYARIFVFLGSQQKNMILESTQSTQVEVIKIKGVGKNNLDFHLIYYLGKCQNNADEQVEFLILSKDTGWDRLIQFINQEGRTCKRVGHLKDSSAQTVSTTNLPTEIQALLKSLNKMSKTQRPKRVDKLTNYIKSINKTIDTPRKANQIVELFKKHGYISVNDNQKVTYIGF